MELFTLDRRFLKVETIDKFHSAIWTERYYGDGDVELIVPITKEKLGILQPGTFLGLIGTNEIMMLETQNVEEGVLKVKGESLLKFLNNRFIRASALHEDRYWRVTGGPVGWAMWAIVYYMCVEGSPYLTGQIATGIPNPQRLAIPNLALATHDTSGSNVEIAVQYGPVFDALKEIGTTYQIGQQIYLESADDTKFQLRYRSYKGLDRTSSQTANEPIRLSPYLETLTDIKELRSISNYITQVYSFAPSNPNGMATVPGQSALVGSEFTGFDLRALQVFADDITTDNVGSDPNVLLQILNTRAQQALYDHPYVRIVDGEVVPSSQFQFGKHYNLGDIVELQGNSDIVQRARVTEYIRTQDDSGAREYPTLAVID